MPLALGLGIGITIGGGVSFSPTALFASGEQGVWYDPSDFSTMFQDSAGTTPVTAAGDPVGKILDKSGRGNHASQSTSASRPVLQQDGGGRYYLSFDGTDDSLATSSITPGTDKVQVFAGIRKLSDTAYQIITEFSASVATNNGSFALLSTSGNGVAASNAVSFSLRGTATAGYDATSFAAPSTMVMAASFDISGATVADEVLPRVNATTPTLSSTGAANAGTGSFGNYPLYIGRRGGSTLPFNGRLYGLVVRFGANLSSAQISSMETWLNARTGAY